MPDDLTTPDVTPVETPAAAAVETTPSVETTATATPAAVATTDTAGTTGESGGMPATPVTPAAVQAAIEEIEAELGEEKIKLRADATIALPSGERVTLDELRRMGLRQADYTRKTMQAADERRATERQRVEIETRGQRLAEQRQRLIDAYAQGGEALERELRHQELLERDPDYRQRFEESEEYRVQQALHTWDEERGTETRAQSAADEARTYIRQQCQQYPELDPAEIEGLYAAALQAGRADLKPSSVDRLIQAERQRVSRVTAPVLTELNALKAKLAALEAERTVTEGNAAVSAAITRTRAPKVGTPAAGAVPITPGLQRFDPEKDNPQDWLRQWRTA